MQNFLFFTAILMRANADYVADSDSYESEEHWVPEVKEVKDVKDFKDDAIYMKYVKNFTELMSAYVKSQNDNLTAVDIVDVQEILEEFLHKFAQDLKEVIDKDKKETYYDIDTIEDGIPEATFENIRENMRKEFPNISEKSVNVIVYKLRKNLFTTRVQLDEVIRAAEQYARDNASLNYS